MKQKIIVDCNALCYRSFYTIGGLSNREKKIGIIFGFINQLIQISKKLKCKDFLFCWDSKKSFRKNEYAEYKGNRRKDLDDRKQVELLDAYRQFNLLRKKILKELGFKNIYLKSGYESDDLIACLVNQLKDKYLLYIVASDNDLYQLLFDNVKIYELSKGRLFTSDDFEKKYGIKYYQWSEVKAIAGCNSDNVAGVVGVGEQTAINYLNGKLVKGKTFDKIVSDSGKQIKERNIKLVKLPYKNIDLEIRKDNLRYENFIKVFNDNNFKSLLMPERINSWRKVFDI